MATLHIVKDGEDVLRKVSRPIPQVTPRVIRLLNDMADTLHKAKGCGLAAPQVGILRRVVIVEAEPGELIELINPVITEKSGVQHEAEGCLSVPGKWGITERPAKVTVKATGRDGNTFTVTGEGLLARALCHEIDHLDGILFYDNAVEMLKPEDIEEK